MALRAVMKHRMSPIDEAREQLRGLFGKDGVAAIEALIDAKLDDLEAALRQSGKYDPNW